MISICGVISRTDAGVYVTQLSNPSRIIFRWQGIPCDFDTEEGVAAAAVL